MNEETTIQERSPDSPAVAPRQDYDGEIGSQVTATFRYMASYVNELGRTASAEACVGAPQSEGGHTMVPLAAVSMQTGFAMGFGGGNSGVGDAQGGGSGAGGGGGGRATSRVVAIVEVSDRGVSVRPVPDVTSLALGLMALVGVIVVSRRGGKLGPLLAAVRPG